MLGYMALKPEKVLNNIKISLNQKGYIKDIPLPVFYAEFMVQTGYGQNKVREWAENFELIKLIEIKNKTMNFL